jgi:hypothetical protein
MRAANLGSSPGGQARSSKRINPLSSAAAQGHRYPRCHAAASLPTPAGGQRLLQLLRLAPRIGDQHGAAVAANRVPQHMRQLAGAVGHVVAAALAGGEHDLEAGWGGVGWGGVGWGGVGWGGVGGVGWGGVGWGGVGWGGVGWGGVAGTALESAASEASVRGFSAPSDPHQAAGAPAPPACLLQDVQALVDVPCLAQHEPLAARLADALAAREVDECERRAADRTVAALARHVEREAEHAVGAAALAVELVLADYAGGLALRGRGARRRAAALKEDKVGGLDRRTWRTPHPPPPPPPARRAPPRASKNSASASCSLRTSALRSPANTRRPRPSSCRPMSAGCVEMSSRS